MEEAQRLSRCVAVWCGSTEVYQTPVPFTPRWRRLKRDSMPLMKRLLRRRFMPTRASRAGFPYANGAPNLSLDFPAMHELAKKQGLPHCGQGL
jgi:myo-inositol-1-phosphate synthase